MNSAAYARSTSAFDQLDRFAAVNTVALDDFICTPHIGAQTTEALENVAVGIAEQVVDYFTKGVARGAVNIPSIAPELLPRLQPYLTLVEKMGSLQSQLCQGGIERVTVEYSGEVSTLSIAPLTIGVLKGLLTPIMENPVNYVNAPIVAKERGIENIFFREDFRRVAFDQLGKIDEVSGQPERLYREGFLQALNRDAIHAARFNLVSIMLTLRPRSFCPIRRSSVYCPCIAAASPTSRPW